jgi:hypothetical protein
LRILLDHSVPAPLRSSLAHHDVRTTAQEGWDTLKNGDLLAVAEAAFDVFVTCDQNIAYQQNLRGRQIAIVAINTNAWPVIGNDPGMVVQAIDRATPGNFQTVNYPKPTLRRRPYPPPS